MARPAKKSESLEIRIPYAAKAAFMERCRGEGTSASEALRGFIEASLAEPAPPAARSNGRVWLRLAAGSLAALGLAGAALPSLAGPLERAGFEQLDADRNGAFDAADFARMDADGDGRITLAEFRRR